MKHCCFGTAMLLGAALAGCNHVPDMTGSYIARDESAQIMLQISSAQGHDVRGKIIAVSRDATGKVTAADRPFDGTIDNRAVNLNVENGSALSLLSGNLTDGGMELTLFAGDTSQKLLFQRADPDSFAGYTEGLRRKGAAVQQEAAANTAREAQARRDAADQDRIASFATEMARRADAISSEVARIEAVAGGYTAVSVRAAQLAHEREKLVAVVGPDDYRVTQIDLTRENNISAAKDRHQEVQDDMKTLHDAAVQHESETLALLTACRNNRALSCTGLNSSMALYRTRAIDFSRAVMRDQQAFDAESRRFR